MNVVGSPRSPQSSPTRPLGSESSGYVQPWARANDRALPESSFQSTPTTEAFPLTSRASARSSGASCLHGPHHAAQKLTSAGLPFNAANVTVAPVSARAGRGGAALPPDPPPEPDAGRK